MIKNKIINLDCTFRDGGYYNNWFFKKSDIDFYIKNIFKTKNKYIEIGFRFMDSSFKKIFYRLIELTSIYLSIIVVRKFF